MDQHALVLVHGVLNEVIDFVGRLISTIEEYLILLIEPRVSQVLHANICPLILHLAAAAIDNSGNFVGDDELEVFCSKGVTDEEAVLDLDGADHVVVHHLLVVHSQSNNTQIFKYYFSLFLFNLLFV